MFICGAAQIELSFKLCLLKGVWQILVRRGEETNLAVILEETVLDIVVWTLCLLSLTKEISSTLEAESLNYDL